MPVLKVNDFNLAYTLECGQTFRFEKVGDWYYVNARDRLFKVRQRGPELAYDGNADETFLRRYFALDHDLDQMLRKIALDDRMTEAIEKYRGLRIMRQDPWECLISFLCSLAKNIRNIQNTVENICERFGKPVSLDGRRSWTFPEPGKLSDLKALRGAKAGFRAGYIVNANSQVTEDFLNGLSSLDYPEARAKLMLLVKGVGGKVADCVLLFAYGFLQAFPVDRWIRREMCRIYFGGQKVAADKIREFAQIYFGGYAGYAQEYLFYHARLAASPEPESKEDE